MSHQVTFNSTRKVPIYVGLDERERGRLGCLADRTGIPMSVHMRRALSEYLDRQPLDSFVDPADFPPLPEIQVTGAR